MVVVKKKHQKKEEKVVCPHCGSTEVVLDKDSHEYFCTKCGFSFPVKGKRRCPECGSTDLVRDPDRGEIYCRNCGFVIDEKMFDFGPEWRAFDADQRTKRARGGAPIKYTRPNKGLVTEIDQYNRDIRGAKISPKQQMELQRMRKWQKRTSISSSLERNLSIALGELERIGAHLGLPHDVREYAALLYRKAAKAELIRGRQIEAVVAAVVYATCRMYGIPKTLDEIAKVCDVEKKDVGRAYRYIHRNLKLNVPLPDPTIYIAKFASVLKLSGKTQQLAKEIVEKAKQKGLLSGRGPTGVAAAALYIASVLAGEKRTQKEVAQVANITEVTIRNRYRELIKALGIRVSV